MKRCHICKQELPPEAFGIDRHKADGLSARCKPCGRVYEAGRRAANPDAHRAKVARWAARNAEKVAEYREGYRERRREVDREWRAANREKVNEKSRRWRALHSEKVAAYNAEYRATRPDPVAAIKKDWNERNPDKVAMHAATRRAKPQYRIEATIRARLHRTLANGRKESPTFAALGYSREDLRQHLERQFVRGMTWDNYGEWHIDHVLPLSSFNYQSTSDADFRAAWALTNLRPMWAEQNIAKGAKRLTLL